MKRQWELKLVIVVGKQRGAPLVSAGMQQQAQRHIRELLEPFQ